MRFSVIIATLGRPEVLRKTIASVAACDPAPLELVVVDGDHFRSSEPETQGVPSPTIRYLTAGPGLPIQRNAGIHAAAGDILVFLDDDVSIPKNTFSVLERVFSDGGVLGATARIVEPHSDRIGKKHSPLRRLLPGGGAEGTFTRYGYPRRLIDLDTERDIQFMHGSFMAVRTPVARALKFDEVLPGYALAEDEDFSYRVSRRGRIRFVPELHVFHAKAGHGGRDARAFGRAVVVNRSYLFKKNFDRTAAARVQFWLLITLLLGHRLINGELSEARGLVQGSFAAVRRPLGPRAGTGTAPPRIAFISSHARSGGSERYLSTLLELLDDDWIGPIICLEDGPLVGELRAKEREVEIVPSSGKPLSVALASLRLRRKLKRIRPSLIHANGIKAALVAAWSRRLAPIVWVKHDFSLGGRLTEIAARRSSVVVGVSAAVLDGLPAGKTEVVHTGLVRSTAPDRTRARAALASELGVAPDGLLVGLVGRLHPVKGHLDLLRALAPETTSLQKLEIVFVGGTDPATPEHARVVEAEAARVGLQPHMLGHRDDVIDVMAGLDLAVMPSSRDGAGDVEALPLTALELLAAGTPLVAYAAGGIPELVGDCAELVPVGDRRALAEAVISLAGDEDRRHELSECGVRRVDSDFTTHRMVEKMMDIYRRTARAGAGRPGETPDWT